MKCNVVCFPLGILSEDLHLFLETNLPKPAKKSKGENYVLGVSEPKLGAAITESLNFPCQHTGAVPEIVRGIRLHFASLVKGMSPCTLVVSYVDRVFSQVLHHKLLLLPNLVWVTAIPEPK